MKKLVTLFLLLFLFCGCTPMRNTAASRPVVVVGITVTHQNGPVATRRYYTSSAKMRSVLDYLRGLNPYGTAPETPTAAMGESYRIVLSHSDGSETLYWQIADRYFLEEGKPWQMIDPEQAGLLGRIFSQTESD